MVLGEDVTDLEGHEQDVAFGPAWVEEPDLKVLEQVEVVDYELHGFETVTKVLG